MTDDPLETWAAAAARRHRPGTLASVSSERTGGRVAVHAVAVAAAGGRCTVTVELRRAEDQSVAILEGVLASVVTRRLIADATLSALASLEPAAQHAAVEAVVVGPVGAQSVVTTTLVYARPTGEEILAGAAVVRAGGEHEAIARAVLDAANRRVIGRELPSDQLA